MFELGMMSVSSLLMIALAVVVGILVLRILFKTAKFIFKLVFTLILLAIVAAVVLQFVFRVSVIGLITGIFAVIWLV